MYLLWILLIPVVWLFIAKFWLRQTFNWKELGISLVATISITSIVWLVGMSSLTHDTEIWNGEVTKKERIHDTYEDPYDCFCTTDTSCQTCYETRYTVTWKANTTVGNVRFLHKDKSSRSVYNSLDPVSYINCKVGEPASSTNSYTNYVKAVPDSLFHDDSKIPEQFKDKIPSYPQVHSFYRLDRVINVDSKISHQVVSDINEKLSIELKTLGFLKQVNIITILTEIDDPSYRYAIEKAWLGAKKNDVVIFIGLDDNNITWVDVMTWALNSGNELFHVTMRDGITDMKVLDANKFVPFVSNTVMKLYDRPQMKDYEYLKDDIEPPTWVIILAIILSLVMSIGSTILFHRTEI